MQTFKKIVTFIIVNVMVVVSLTLMLAKPSVVKLLMKEAKSPEYDTLIIGESHAVNGYDPLVISKVMGNKVFNMSRGLMPLPNLYYILEEVNVHGQYKKVILDLDASYFEDDNKGNIGTDSNLFWKLTGSRRLDYTRNILLNENYNDIFADYTVETSTIKQIPRNLKCKLRKEYFSGGESAIQSTYSMIVSDEGSYEYEGRGFLRGIKETESDYVSKDFDVNNIKQKNVEAFQKIVNYCKDNDIDLVCVQSSLPPYRLENENLDAVHDYFTKLCEKNSVPFYDLNYLKSEYLSRTDDNYVDLDGHMMGELADKQSAVFAEILLSDSKEKYFYDNYDDVINNLN